MNPSSIVLAIASLASTQTYAAATPLDTPLAGVSMSLAKRLDARSLPEVSVTPAKLSGVPMAIAARLDASKPSGQASTSGRMLTGVPMALAKRL